jgi:hypothetical protein
MEHATWEICTIIRAEIDPGRGFAPAKYKYWARAEGRNGEYNAGETPVLDYVWNPNTAAARQAYQTLFDTLLKAGWEPLPQRVGEPDRFRRPLPATDLPTQRLGSPPAP